MVWIYTIISVIIISLVSLVGVLALFLKKEKLEHLLLYLVSFSVGALLGDVFLHILPEITDEYGYSPIIGFYFLSGVILFFILEKIVHWHHCHHAEHSDHRIKPMVITNLVGDGFHNFLDGMIIAGSYLVSIPVGVATTLAVLFHEIPQEIGDFGVLVHGGLSRSRALLFNIFSAFIAVIGAIFALIIAKKIDNIELFLLAIAGGGFIYIAGSDLIPELHKIECRGCKPWLQLLFIILGVGVMATFLIVE